MFIPVTSLFSSVRANLLWTDWGYLSITRWQTAQTFVSQLGFWSIVLALLVDLILKKRIIAG